MSISKELQNSTHIKGGKKVSVNKQYNVIYADP